MAGWGHGEHDDRGVRPVIARRHGIGGLTSDHGGDRAPAGARMAAPRRAAGIGMLVACCLSPGLAAAQAAGGDPGTATGPLRLTLEQAIFFALKNSRAAFGARLGRDEEALSREADEERYLPRVDTSANVAGGKDRDRTSNVGVGPSLRVPTGGTFRLSWSRPVEGPGEHASTTTLNFNQPLLKGFGPDVDMVSLRKSRMRQRIDLRAFRDRVAGIIGSVIGAYRGALSAGRRVAIAREALERARRQLEINRALVEAGRMARRDLVQSEASVANREYALSESEHALEFANAALANVLDLDEGVRIEPSEEPEIEPERPDFENSLEDAFAHRTDWLRAELAVRFARMDLRVAENNTLPNLSLNASTTRRAGQNAETDYAWSFNLSVPLWDHNPRRALVRARNSVKRAQMARAEARQSIRIQVRRAVRSVARTLRQIDVAGQALQLSRQKLEIERLKLREGLSSSFNVSRSEDDLIAAERRQLDAVVGYRNALDSLSRTLGTTLDRWGIDVEQVGR